jgi:hypothetical protein
MSYVLLPASKSKVRKLLRFAVADDFWMTYRLPFQKDVRVTYPDKELSPATSDVLKHELFHVVQFSTWYGPIVILLLVSILPLPIIFSGRWFVERHAYLADIKAMRRTTKDAVNFLWYSYGWCWPKSLMRKWFDSKIKGRS